MEKLAVVLLAILEALLFCCIAGLVAASCADGARPQAVVACIGGVVVFVAVWYALVALITGRVS